MMMISGHGSGGGEDSSTSTTTTCPPWKLYHNPFFYNNPLPLHNRQQLMSNNSVDVIMSAKIEELTEALEHERRARRKSEHLNKRLAKELCKERRGREALEHVCEELAKEISSIDKMKKDMEEERRMLWMAEVLREERVQMKLADAKIILEEKMSQLKMNDGVVAATVSSTSDQGLFKTRKPRRPVLGEKLTSSDDNVTNKNSNKNSVVMVTRRAMRGAAESETAAMKLGILRRPSSEPPENPHIKRGIKGFVEFPRVVRAAVGSKSRYHWGTKLECQKAQIRILLKQRSPLRSSDQHLIWSK